MTTSSPETEPNCPGRCLESLGLQDDPISNPLIYPGRLPPESGLLANKCFLPLHDNGANEVGRWLLEITGWTPMGEARGGANQVPLDDILRRLNQPVITRRHPILAVGSNASPGQLNKKFAAQSTSSIVPMTLAMVHGLVPGVSAHVGRFGYVAATPLRDPSAAPWLFVLWLCAHQLVAIDATEPNYNRILLPASRFRIELAGRLALESCWAYVSKHGCLTDPDGAPRRLLPQPVLLKSLLADVPTLSDLCGPTPEAFVRAARDPFIRESVRRLFLREGIVLGQPEMLALAEPTDP
jgi:hypothetical protein